MPFCFSHLFRAVPSWACRWFRPLVLIPCRSSPQVYVDATVRVIAGYGWGCSSFHRFCRVKSWYFHGNDRCDTRDEVCLGRDDNSPPPGVEREHSPNSVQLHCLMMCSPPTPQLLEPFQLCTSTVPLLIFSLELRWDSWLSFSVLWPLLCDD